MAVVYAVSLAVAVVAVGAVAVLVVGLDRRQGDTL